MFCSKCGMYISENANFCGNCGNSLERPKSKNTKQPLNKKKSKVIIVCIILVVCLIVGVLLTPIVLNKIQQKKIAEMVNILSSGYWMAMTYENNINLTEYDYYNDFGLIFDDNLYFNQMYAITTDSQILSCDIADNEYLLYESINDNEFRQIFSMQYDKKEDKLILTGSTKYFNSEINEEVVTIYLSHFTDESINTELEKKLYFECWSTVDGDYSGTENKVKTDMFNEYPDADVIRFFKTGTRQFNYSDINCFRWNYSEVGFVYTPTTFEISDEYKHNGVKMIGYSFNDSCYDYLRYDEKNDYLVSDATGNKLYCITNYEKTLQDYYDSKTAWVYEN